MQNQEEPTKQSLNSDMEQAEMQPPANVEPYLAESDMQAIHAPAKRESWPHALLSYAIKGILFGSAAAVLISIFIPNWVPITRMGMSTMLLIDALIGMATLLLQRSDLPLFVIIPLHLVCTLLISIGWICINGWQWHVFHEELTLFVVGFIVVYVVIWGGILLYFDFVTSNINKRLSDRMRVHRKN